MPCPLEGRKAPGLLFLSAGRQPGRPHLVEARRLFPSYPPSSRSAFTFPVGECRAPHGWGRTSLPEECGSRFPRRAGPAPTSFPAVQSGEPCCLHCTLRQDPVSKSPESHFLPRPPLPCTPCKSPGPSICLEQVFLFLACF